MNKFFTLLSALIVTSGAANAQLSVTNVNTNFTIDFDNNVAGVNNVAYAGTGGQSSPSAGQFDSDGWAVTGWSNGSLAFGGTQTTAATDYTRGASAAAVTTGGFYAFSGGSITGVAFGIQPGGTDWAPGTLTLKITNNTGVAITSLSVAYNVHVRNDQGRSSSFNFSHSTDDVTYTPVGALDLTSTATLDALGFVANAKSTTITSLNIANGANFFIRWSGTDIAGSGSRDEFALDDIVINANQAMPISLVKFTADKLSEKVKISWTTATEINNDKFIVERSADGENFDVVTEVRGAGNSKEINTYEALDIAPLKGTSYYRLTQYDFDGKSESFAPVAVRMDAGSLKLEAVSSKLEAGSVEMSIYSPIATATSIRVMDLSGRIIASENINLVEGYQTVNINANALSSGIHIIQVMSGEEVVMKKLVL